MKILSSDSEVARELAKALHKPLLYFGPVYSAHGEGIDWQEAIKAAPWIGNEYGLLMEGGVVVCDSVDEQERLYEMTVGDDGPTPANPYNGPFRVYALTIDENGEAGMENT